MGVLFSLHRGDGDWEGAWADRAQVGETRRERLLCLAHVTGYLQGSWGAPDLVITVVHGTLLTHYGVNKTV